jgi:preprotein translocase subunit SecD
MFVAAILVVGCEQRHKGLPVAQADSRGPILQVGLVLDSPAVDSVQMAFAQKKRGGTHTNEILTVRVIKGLDDTNLEKLKRVWQRGDAVAAEVCFKGKAREQFADFTRTNIGKDIVLIIDGKAFWTMVIGGEEPDGRMLIRGDWTLKAAQAFCKRIEVATRN